MVDRIYTTCRVCLKEGKNNISMYANDNTNCRYLIEKYTGIDMIPNTNLPNVICDVCTSELTVVINFVKKCRYSNEKLQEALNLQIPFDDIPFSYIKKEQKYACKTFENVYTNVKSNLSDISSFPTDFKHEEKQSNASIDNLLKDKPKACRILVKRNEISLKVNSEVKKNNNAELIEENFICNVCGKESESKIALVIHKSIHSDEKKLECPYCIRRFVDQTILDEHIGKVHLKRANLKNSICGVCGKKWKTKSDLKVHMRTHTNEKPYHCSYCPRSFSQPGTLSLHIRLHTGERPFSCQVCYRTYRSRIARNSHYNVHIKEKNYKCHLCGKALKSAGAVKQHLDNIHSSYKPYVCEQCGMAFRQKGTLKFHVNSIHSERSGMCDICGKIYSNLPEHVTVHTGEKPYICKTCNKGFRYKRHLTTHLKLHLEPDKYPCRYENCGATFSMPHLLRSHTFKHHSKNTLYMCSFCPKQFNRLKDFTRHQSKGDCEKNAPMMNHLEVV